MHIIDMIVIVLSIASVWQFLCRPLLLKEAKAVSKCSCGCSGCHYSDQCHDKRKS